MNSRGVAAFQPGYYIGTGLWPLAHRRSFERLTGPKADFWLAQTVGVTVAAIGIGLAHAAARRRPVPPELRTTKVGAGEISALVEAERDPMDIDNKQELKREADQSVRGANEKVCSAKHELADSDAAQLATPVPSPARAGQNDA